MRIFIIGMPGSGKTYIGRVLSNTFKLKYIDLDENIEKQEGKMIKYIIEEHGEQYFRILEQQTLHNTAIQQQIIVSCGGGTPAYFDNMEWMKQKGIVIWLNTSLMVISERIFKNITRRPMFIGMNKPQVDAKVFELFDKRKKYYTQSNIILDNNEFRKSSVNGVVQQIIKLMKRKKK